MNQISAQTGQVPQDRPTTDAVRALPMFAEVDADVVARVADIAAYRTLEPGEKLFTQGTTDMGLHLLVSGQISTFRTAHDGTVTVIDVTRPPGHLGLQAVLARLPSLVSAEAVSTSRVITVDGQGLLSLLSEEPSLAGALLKAEASDVRSLVLQVCDLKLRTTAQRLGHYLLSLAPDPMGASASLRLPFDKRLLAARLGCRQENLSRAFATLRELGVETHGSRVTMSDLARLRAYAVAFDEP
jgi:CRP-like cAMP-binding protein